MDLALWIVGGWVGLSVAGGVAVSVVALLRDQREAAGLATAPVAFDDVSRPDRGAPPR